MRRILAITALAALLAACGGYNGGNGDDGGDGTAVDVTLTDFEIGFSEQPSEPGTYTFTVTNDGKAEHALEVEGQGMEEATDNLAPGDSATLTVTLKQGSYTFYCPVGDHEQRGMTTKVKIGGGGGDKPRY